MNIATLATDVKQALMLVLLLSMPVVLAVGVTGLLLAFLQAVTQMQDQTMAFGIKLVVAVIVIALMSGWLGGELFTFADGLFASIALVR
ncbi:type III secretion protein S [Collimonas sp. PA-H2]|jgi:type III secretion protein S|uniref:type III secretion system export apparatus subunit SctS n=1 Tax=unclassified Collimonas TaxID=2634148 RepID=UPI000894B6C7|nr:MULTISPECIES: type III secretion system export apparatus subunit SctS [unclassified Collimonas]PFH08645.1 type III secretion protein S [Collimonas sp. PA-H2]SDY73047.1 type III secretion protein S [Collimonas sp. OK242]